MWNVSDEFKAAINSDSRNMTHRITLYNGNEKIKLDKSVVTNMVLTESMSGNNGVVIGATNSAELTITLKHPGVREYKGMNLFAESGIVTANGETEWAPLGMFWVTKVHTGNNYETVKLTCADGMYLLAGEYIPSIGFPARISKVYEDIAGRAGVVCLAPEKWPDITVREKPKNVTMRALLGYIAGCCGCNARFDRLGQLELVWYEDNGVVIERNLQYLDGLEKLHDKPLAVNIEVTGAKEPFACSVECGRNGSATATPSKPVYEGDTVTVSVCPDKGYRLYDIHVWDESDNYIELTTQVEGSGYTFVQPAGDVTVFVSFRPMADVPFKLTIHPSTFGEIGYAESEIGYPEGPGYFAAGEEVVLFVTPYSGYTVSHFATIPHGITPEFLGIDGDEAMYSFIMPESDVDLTVEFQKASARAIIWALDDECPPGSASVLIANETNPASGTYNAGDLVSVHVSVAAGYELHYVQCTALDDILFGESDFTFTMPDETVYITVYVRASEDNSKDGLYSFLEPVSRATPPTSKPYWAVFYKHDVEVGPNGRFYLVWFDYWYVNSDASYGYEICTDGSYYCNSENNGNAMHSWDTSVWYGNGTGGSLWNVDKNGYHGGKLIASNTNLYYNGSELRFQKCPSAIGDVQTHWAADGVDRREVGVLTTYACPDTYSTPPPGQHWFVLSGVGLFDSNDELLYSGTGMYWVYFDHASVEFIERSSPDKHDFYKFTFPRATVMSAFSLSGNVGKKVVDDECYIRITDPAYSSLNYTRALGGIYAGGFFATNVTFTNDVITLFDNSPIVCDCETAVSTFSLRKSSVAADTVTLTYTNPLIYEKTAQFVQNLVQDVTYTPARLKHRGNPALQAGDIVTVPDGSGTYHNVIIMQQTLTFGGGMNSEITCPGQPDDAANFSATNPMSMQIKEEVSKTVSEMSHETQGQTSGALAAVYSAIDATSRALKKEISEKDVTKEMESLSRQMSAVEDDLYELGERVAVLEDKTELGDLKRQLAETDKQIAHCAEVFMLEVMLNGVATTDVVLPYDIAELHNTRETLRASIAELEVETNE